VKLIVGPCVIESVDHALFLAKRIKLVTDLYPELDVYFKASFDKANRSDRDSYRGPGLDLGLAILDKIKKETGLKILTDIHTPDQAGAVAEVADIIQIPAFLCRQTDLIEAAAKTGKTINIKKGQFVAPYDIRPAYEKAAVHAGESNVWLTERGTCFGYNNLVVDMRSFQMMREVCSNATIIYDATHSMQLPGGRESDGARRFTEGVARAAVATGFVDGIFMEVHDDPEAALSDRKTQYPLDKLGSFIKDTLRVRGSHENRS
jgi:2-dehydro-3-deoxyphosphooctonate aldolase (KDO 8-P synthase)